MPTVKGAHNIEVLLKLVLLLQIAAVYWNCPHLQPNLPAPTHVGKINESKSLCYRYTIYLSKMKGKKKQNID